MQDDAHLLARSPLSKTLLTKITGVKSLYLGADYISVTKKSVIKWEMIRPQIFEAIMDFYSDVPPGEFKNIMIDSSDLPVSDTTILDTDSEVVAMIKELLETRIRPAVMEDGGDIFYVGFDESTGLVTVRLAGSCVGCPSSSITLKNGVENMLQHYIPEVEGVVAMEEEEIDEEGGSSSSSSSSSSSISSTATVEVTKTSAEAVKQKSYEDKLREAGIPFSD